MTDQAEAAARKIVRATPRQMAEQAVADFSLGNGSLTILAFREKQLAVIEAAIAAAIRSAEPQWQPIESAPKDGTVVDLWCRAPGLSAGPARVPDCWYSDGRWWRYDEQFGDDQRRSRVHNATHWMPLPAPPEAISGKEPGA